MTHARTALQPYAADVSATVAWEKISTEKKAQLIDVRTESEWRSVGMPDLSSVGKKPIFLSLFFAPDMTENVAFADEIMQAVPDRDTPLYFMCRSGGRSAQAATLMTQRGYTQCYNIFDGFEGEPDARGHLCTVNGWRAQQLPWRQ
ncbi:MAG: rhodanese-like domain-containing protein [Alphaproteobacteria bacterium]|nr:rhodanese-like domain-containing protein [Alphaproteobacteria bacterium]